MDELRCNSLKCRKALVLEGSAVVTTCSHIFCCDCANELFGQPQVCPACETALPDSDDAVRMEFNLSDSYKTSVLSGLAPVTILDIASRAMNFYTYQIQQESAFQTLVSKNAQERIAVLEAQNDRIVREAHSEINLLRNQLTNANKELEHERRRVRDLTETHKANAKAYTKLKAQYDKSKQRALLQPGPAAPLPAPSPAPFLHPSYTSTPYAGTPSYHASAHGSHRSLGPLQALDLNQLAFGWSAGQANAQPGSAIPSAAATPRRAEAGPRSSLQEVQHAKGSQGAHGRANMTGGGGGLARPGTSQGRPAAPGFLGQGSSGGGGGGGGGGAGQGLGHGGGGHFKSQVNATKRRASSGSSGSPPAGGLVNGMVGGMPQYLGQPAPSHRGLSRGESRPGGKADPLKPDADPS